MVGIPMRGFEEQKLSEKTTGQVLNASFKTTTADQNSVFVEWVIPENLVVQIIDHQPLLLKIYSSGGTEPTKGPLMLVFKRPQDAIYTQVADFGDYSLYASLSWSQQLSNVVRDQEKIHIGYPFIRVHTGETIGFMIKTSTVLPTSPYAQTKLSYPFFHISTAQYQTLRFAEGLAEERRKKREGTKL